MQSAACNVWCTILLRKKLIRGRAGSGLQLGEKAFNLCFVFGMGSDTSARLFVNWFCVDDLIYFQMRRKITITAIVILFSLVKMISTEDLE